MMNSNTTTTREATAWTYVGLGISLLAIPLIAFVFRQLFGPATAGVALARELAIIACAALLIWIIRSRERLSLASIDLVKLPAGRLAGWVLVTLVGCAVALVIGLLCVQAFGLRFGSAPGTVSVKLPMWVTFLVVVRAGIVEELFYRGYAINRLELLSGSRVVAVVIPLLIFATFHYTQGAGGVLISLLLGGVLTGIYLWKRNLLVVMLAHFLVDFIPNIVLPLISGE
jgi:membrane protease YdiL (CAAX protease family)